MKSKNGILSNITKSGFMRSVITRILAIFIVVSMIIAAVAFFSFTAEIRKSVLSDKQMQLAVVEESISNRMNEITSIAYNIGNDTAFYLGAVKTDARSGREMSAMLKRYLVGNSFIEHLAFCRTAEPDTIYVSTGERSLSEFFGTNFHMDKATIDYIISVIHNETRTRVALYGSGDGAYFAYVYPLPQLAEKPQAHILMLIPVKAVQPLFETLLVNSSGLVAVFDAEGREIYQTGNIDEEISLAQFVQSDSAEQNYQALSKEKYVLQKVVSPANNWTYVSVIRQSDTLSGLANKQLALIMFILLMLVAAVILMLTSIITQFKPIRNLAEQMAGHKHDENGVLDERKLLPDKMATLKDDSEQKQKYENAFYEAEAASKAKSAFLSSMSHDIRTPMNAIIGMTAIARKHIGDQSYVDECLKKVQVSSEYLLDIINNVLDMSRIESGRIPIAKEPLLIPALMDSVISLMTSGADAKSQKIELAIDELSHPAVLGDNVHMVQVFVNIVSNAVKFTPEGGTIKINVEQSLSFDDNSGMYIFTFADTGIGIPPEFIGQVFDTFARANDAVSSKTEGTGLGMAIAKKLIELMGGTIKCESELNKGTTFTVALRMEYANEDDIMMLSGKTNRLRADNIFDTIDLTGKRILLVEDNAMNRDIANRILSETGAEIIEANDGEKAVEAFTNNPAGYFDIIFMDIQMPVMNGYDAARAIRSSKREDAATVPIYAMTANTFDEDVRQVKDAGMNGHIGKPYSPKTLYTVLANALKE